MGFNSVYELLVDWDGTTRSHPSSEGLFHSEKQAWNHDVHIRKANPKGIYGKSYVEKRKVIGSN